MHQNAKNRGCGNSWPSDGVRIPCEVSTIPQ